jgi:hypothetical protein
MAAYRSRVVGAAGEMAAAAAKVPRRSVTCTTAEAGRTATSSTPAGMPATTSAGMPATATARVAATTPASASMPTTTATVLRHSGRRCAQQHAENTRCEKEAPTFNAHDSHSVNGQPFKAWPH